MDNLDFSLPILDFARQMNSNFLPGTETAHAHAFGQENP